MEIPKILYKIGDAVSVLIMLYLGIRLVFTPNHFDRWSIALIGAIFLLQAVIKALDIYRYYKSKNA